MPANNEWTVGSYNVRFAYTDPVTGERFEDESQFDAISSESELLELAEGLARDEAGAAVDNVELVSFELDERATAEAAKWEEEERKRTQEQELEQRSRIYGPADLDEFAVMEYMKYAVKCADVPRLNEISDAQWKELSSRLVNVADIEYFLLDYAESVSEERALNGEGYTPKTMSEWIDEWHLNYIMHVQIEYENYDYVKVIDRFAHASAYFQNFGLYKEELEQYEKKRNIYVIDSFGYDPERHEARCALLKWEGAVEPFVIVNNFDFATKNWAQGTYFSSLGAAMHAYSQEYSFAKDTGVLSVSETKDLLPEEYMSRDDKLAIYNAVQHEYDLADALNAFQEQGIENPTDEMLEDAVYRKGKIEEFEDMNENIRVAVEEVVENFVPARVVRLQDELDRIPKMSAPDQAQEWALFAGAKLENCCHELADIANHELDSELHSSLYKGNIEPFIDTLHELSVSDLESIDHNLLVSALRLEDELQSYKTNWEQSIGEPARIRDKNIATAERLPGLSEEEKRVIAEYPQELSVNAVAQYQRDWPDRTITATECKEIEEYAKHPESDVSHDRAMSRDVSKSASRTGR